MNKKIQYYFFKKKHCYPHHEQLDLLISENTSRLSGGIKIITELYIKEKDIRKVAELLGYSRERVRQVLQKAYFQLTRAKTADHTMKYGDYHYYEEN